jgi:hypothetical protein
MKWVGWRVKCVAIIDLSNQGKTVSDTSMHNLGIDTTKEHLETPNNLIDCIDQVMR